MGMCQVIQPAGSTSVFRSRLAAATLATLLLLAGCRATTQTRPPTATAPVERAHLTTPTPEATSSLAVAGELVQVGPAEGIIFSVEFAVEAGLSRLPDGTTNDGFWTPTAADIQAMEAALPAFLQAEEQRDGSLVQQRAAEGLYQQLERYTRQYVGIIAGDQRLIWGNYFCHHGGEWQEQLVLVEDGGACYFNVTFNPATGEFSNLDINGES